MLTDSQINDLLPDLLKQASEEWDRLARFSSYHRGEHDSPYSPKQRSREFVALAERSKTNLVPLVIETLTDRLYVDGYRPETSEAAVQDSPAWEWWQSNSLDARQKQVYKATAIYGYSYVQVWPGEGGTPVLRPYSPRAWYAHYDFMDDDWPVFAVRSSGKRVWLLDDEALYVVDDVSSDADAKPLFRTERTAEHGLGVCPLVRFMNAWPDEDLQPVGEVEKVVHIQDRLNQTVFDLLQAQSFMGVPQRYVTNLITEDWDKLSQAVQGAQRFLGFQGDAEVGQLPAADLSNLVTSIDNCLRIFGQVSQTPPHYLLGQMVNMSSDALVAAEANLASKVEERQSLHGEAWEQVFRLSGVAANDVDVAADNASQVVWRNTDPRSLSSTVDALGKMVQMLGVPPDEVWQMVPGVTQQDVARWREKADSADPFVALQQELERQGQSLFADSEAA